MDYTSRRVEDIIARDPWLIDAQEDETMSHNLTAPGWTSYEELHALPLGFPRMATFAIQSKRFVSQN